MIRATSLPARWLAAVFLLAATPAAGTAQVFDVPGAVYGNGTELFRAILHNAKIKPLSYGEYAERGRPTDTIVIILGPRPDDGGMQVNTEFFAYQIAREVLRGGGAVLFASDTEVNIGAWLPGTPRLAVHSHRVHATAPQHLHTERNDSVVLVTREPGRGLGPVGDVFRGLHRVVTENPSCLVVGDYRSPVHDRLAWFPPSSYFVPFENPQPPVRNPDHPPTPDRNPFAVGGAGPDFGSNRPYRFLAMADQAVLLNRLVADPSTDNLELARRVVTFLQDPDGQNRTHCLFVVRGTVVEKFDTAYQYAVAPPSVPSLGLPPWEKVERLIVDGGNRLIDQAEENDALNRMALGPDSQPIRQHRNLVGLMQALFVIGSVWAVWFVLRRVWRARQPGDQPRPPVIGGAPKPGPAGIFDRREQELLRRNNLYEPVRELLRDFFSAAGAPPDTGRKPSHLVFEGTGAKPARLRKAIDELWRIAYGRATLVTVYQWQELEPKFEMVRQAFKDGIWRFQGATVTGRGEG
jgi:hypothetical protein